MKNITKIEQMRLFLFTFLVSFFIAFLAQNLFYAISIYFTFVFGSFFGLCEKITQMCTHFKTETVEAQNLINDFLTEL